MAETRRVCCTACEQTFVTEEVAKCPLCGNVGGLTDVATGKPFWQSREVSEEGITTQPQVFQERWQEPAPASAPTGPYPVSKVCPQCGHTEFRQTRPESWVAFGWDRICKSCNTRYTPPTPVWAGVVFILAGLPLAGMGLLTLIGITLSGPVGLPNLLCWGPLGLAGLLSIIHGIRSLANPGKA
jgi:hypothetical protein